MHCIRPNKIVKFVRSHIYTRATLLEKTGKQLLLPGETYIKLYEFFRNKNFIVLNIMVLCEKELQEMFMSVSMRDWMQKTHPRREFYESIVTPTVLCMPWWNKIKTLVRITSSVTKLLMLADQESPCNADVYVALNKTRTENLKSHTTRRDHIFCRCGIYPEKISEKETILCRSNLCRCLAERKATETGVLPIQ